MFLRVAAWADAGRLIASDAVQQVREVGSRASPKPDR